MLLLAAFAAAPAYAQDAGGDVSTPPASDPAPPPPVTDPTPPADPAPTPDPTATTPPADTTPPATETPAATDPGAGQSTPATNDSPADAGHRQPARPNDEFTTTTSGPSASATSPSSSTAGPSNDLTGSKSGYSDSWLGQDTFVIDKTTTKDHQGLKTVGRRFAGLFLLGASTKATRIEAKARRAHETAKVSALGSGGPPSPGNPLPNQNPFFNLLSGSSGIAASLMLASVLAVLGAAFVLPRDRLRAFRTPTVTWSPLAYVPPIELPG